jgi:hypothetical protein
MYVNQPSTAIKKYLGQSTYNEKPIILVHSLEVPVHVQLAPLHQACDET